MTVKIGHCHRYLLSTTFGKWNLFEGDAYPFTGKTMFMKGSWIRPEKPLMMKYVSVRIIEYAVKVYRHIQEQKLVDSLPPFISSDSLIVLSCSHYFIVIIHYEFCIVTIYVWLWAVLV